MNDKQLNARLGWLSLTLTHQRNILAKALLRLQSVGARLSVSLGLQKKFVRLMEQIAYDKEIEKDILVEIEEVEKRHQELKARKMLRRADAEAPAPKAEVVLENAPKDQPPHRSGLSYLFSLLLLLSLTRKKQKNQDLTVD
jgi:hypothetical protein